MGGINCCNGRESVKVTSQSHGYFHCSLQLIRVPVVFSHKMGKVMKDKGFDQIKKANPIHGQSQMATLQLQAILQ